MTGTTAITFIVYLVAMLAIGVAAYRLTSNLSDYILGGRRLGPGVAALSAGASDMSGWLLLGLPGAVFAAGMNQIWIAIGLTFGAFLNWWYVAGRLRIYTEVAADSLTLPDFLENRFRDRSRLLRVISAIVILLFFTFYTSSGMVAGAKLFEASFDMSYTSALWVGAAVIISYTFLGGFLAVSWTDFVQGILMFLALCAVPIVTIMEVGGWNATVSEVAAFDPGYLDAFHEMTLLGIVSLMAWGLGYFGQPHILARFMALRSAADVPKARFIGMGWMVVSLFGAIFTGFVGVAYLSRGELGDAEQVFILLTDVLFHPVISGILLAAILAAVMSTIDSQLLVSSSAITEDFYKQLFRRDASEKELVWIGRISVAVIALIAIWMASDPERSVLDLVSYAWAGFGGAFGPIVILSLTWERLSRNGALLGIIVGALTVVIWGELSGGLFDVYEILPAFILCGATAIMVSLLGKEASPEVREEFAHVRSEFDRAK
ncbi:Proline/sodium symporter PutP [Caenispirillum salinarum AK4]|uniref:Sodium/proline symporter n=1 Tax=Caenispirillum salinarum AK4 TaxID=1238182 RepID=K9H3X2_9PROT|nr:sodium/proline symporter PutP [Caenispirillum salinarum]EKV31744.1 Proline/sodium symporter PutP [Caenispirillum salinarum AK4]